MRRKVSAVSAKESAHTAQASQEAIRMLIPPSLPCPCSLVPSVTTPLYSTTVSPALRQPLRAGVPEEYPPAPTAHEDMGASQRMGTWGQLVSTVQWFNLATAPKL